MNQRELARDIARRSNLPGSVVGQGLSVLPELVTNSLQDDENVRIVNFGTFETIRYPSRTVRNPRDPSKKILMLAHAVPKFHPSGTFKGRLRSRRAAGNTAVASPLPAAPPALPSSPPKASTRVRVIDRPSDVVLKQTETVPLSDLLPPRSGARGSRRAGALR